MEGPSAPDLRRHHEERDPKKNAETTPPDSECIQLNSLWVVEFFPPSTRDDLVASLKRLGWSTEIDTLLHQAPIQWIEAARLKSNGAGWLTLGTITPSEASGWRGTRRAELPDGVSHAFAAAHQLLPSHTEIVFQFVFDDSVANVLDDSLRAYYPTRYRPLASGGGVYESPENQKRAAVRLARKRMRDTCTDWLRTNLPGTFSKGAFGGEFPTCEFITLRERQPFSSRRAPHPDYLWVLGLEDRPDSWEAKDFPGLRLSTDESIWEAGFHLVLAGREEDLFARDDLEFYGGPNRHGLAACLDDLHPWVARWALSVQLTAYERRVAELRDRATEQSDVSISAAKHIQDVGRSLLELRRDTAPFLSDLNALINEVGYFVNADAEFFALEPRFRGPENLLELIRQNLVRRTSAIRTQQSELMEALLTESNVIAATAQLRLGETNTKLQHAMTWLTVFIAALTVALLVLTVRMV